MASKYCARCGALYTSLKSATCPQCFALLDTIDDETAQELTSAKAKEEASDEFREAKKQDNERWAEQSFQACLGIAAIALVTAVVCVIVLVAALRGHRHATARNMPAIQNNTAGTSAGPSGAALPDELLPASVGQYVRKSLQSDIALPGEAGAVMHASYGIQRETEDVYVMRWEPVGPQRDAFQLGTAMAARGSAAAARPIAAGDTSRWSFAVVGDSEAGGDGRAKALLAYLTR